MSMWQIKRRTLKARLYLGVGFILFSVIVMATLSFYLVVEEIAKTDQVIAAEFEQQQLDAQAVANLERIIGQAQGYTTIWDDAVLTQYREDIGAGIDDIGEIIASSSRPQPLQQSVQSSLKLLSKSVIDIFQAHEARRRFFFLFEGNQYDLSRFVLLVHQDLNQWVDALRDAAQFDVPFQGTLEHTQSLYARWYRQHKGSTGDVALEELLQRYQVLNQKIYRFGRKVDRAEGALRMSHLTRGMNRQIYKANLLLRKIEEHINPIVDQANLTESQAIYDLGINIDDFRRLIELYREAGVSKLAQTKLLLSRFQDRVYFFFYWGLLLLLVLSIVFVTQFIKGIHGPIDAITHTIRKISNEGMLTHRTGVSGHGEVADAAVALNQLLENLEIVFAHTQTIMERMAQGDYSERVDVEVQGDLLRLKRSINQGISDLHSSMDEINQVLIAISFGNYGYRVEGEYHGALEVTKTNINIAAAALQKKTAALEEAKETLEQKVIERTQQLEELNKSLEVEIDQRKQAEENLKQMAHYDVLTGLPNRILLMDRLHLELARADREETQVALLFIDLDGFKQVNDTLGHDAGDYLLIESGRRLKSSIRAVDTVSRLGGDEFIVLLVGWSDPSFISTFSQKVVDHLSTPVTIQNREVSVGASIGIACYPDDAKSDAELLKNADLAMYQAKKMGKGQFYQYVPDDNMSMEE